MFLQTQLNLKTQVESKIMLSDNTLCICVPHVKDQIPKKEEDREERRGKQSKSRALGED